MWIPLFNVTYMSLDFIQHIYTRYISWSYFNKFIDKFLTGKPTKASWKSRSQIVSRIKNSAMEREEQTVIDCKSFQHGLLIKTSIYNHWNVQGRNYFIAVNFLWYIVIIVQKFNHTKGTFIRLSVVLLHWNSGHDSSLIVW